jgi:SAM-dependent methyltransferase
MKIDLGSGYKNSEDFVRLDIDPKTNPDFVVDFEKDNLPFEDNTVDEVRCWHILEHIGQGYFHLMQEIYRVCKPGAMIEIQVPHHTHDCFWNDPTHLRPITVEGLRLFSKKFNQYDIDRGGSCSALGLRFNVDFEIVAQNFIPDSYYMTFIKNNEDKEINHHFREHVNCVIETHVILAVIK